MEAKICRIVDEESFALRNRALGLNGLRRLTLEPEKNNIDKDISTFTTVGLVDEGKQDQNATGRCWMFAYISSLRHRTGIQISPAFMSFWDKYERCSHFLSLMVRQKNSGKTWGDASLEFFLSRENILQDGGNVVFFTNLLAKYGCVPHYEFRDTHHSSNTEEVNDVLINTVLRAAHSIFQAAPETAAAIQDQTMEDVLRVLLLFFGKPPDQVVFRGNEFKPVEFYKHLLTGDGGSSADADTLIYFSDIACFDDGVGVLEGVKHCRIEDLTNIEGEESCFLMVPSHELRNLTLKSLEKGFAVWFACSMDQTIMFQDYGIMDTNLFEVDKMLFPGRPPTVTRKTDRLHSRTETAEHAMLIVGSRVVTCQDGQECREWLVENSWGTECCKEGMAFMTDSFFEKHVYSVGVPTRVLGQSHLDALGRQPVTLAPNHPLRTAAFVK